MERQTCEVQVNSELVTNPQVRNEVIAALGEIFVLAAGHALLAEKVGPDRLRIETSRASFEQAAKEARPQMVKELLFAAFDPLP